MSKRPHIVIATQSVEGNPPALRLLKVCSEFGEVTVVTPHAGPSEAEGVRFRRIIPEKERFYRGLRVLCRKAGRLLPHRMRKKWIDGFTEELLGVHHQGRSFARAWYRYGLQPDLLVLDGAEYMTGALPLAAAARAKLVYYVHEMFPNQRAHYSPALAARFCALERRGCRQADHVIVQHHLWGKLLRRRYRLRGVRFTEVTPSPDPLEPLPGSEPNQPLRLYYHGIYTAGRGLEQLVGGVALVSGVVLDLRGIGDFKQTLEQIAYASGAGERIRFLPALPPDELASSGRSYDLGVMTGTKEHLNGRMAAGMKLYQNIAAGIGLLGFHAITVRNMVRRYALGIAYDGTTAESVADSLRHCLELRDEIPAMRRRAAEVARSYFNSETQYARLRQVIAGALTR